MLVLHDYSDEKGIAHLRSLSADALMDLPKVHEGVAESDRRWAMPFSSE